MGKSAKSGIRNEYSSSDIQDWQIGKNKGLFTWNVDCVRVLDSLKEYRKEPSLGDCWSNSVCKFLSQELRPAWIVHSPLNLRFCLLLLHTVCCAVSHDGVHSRSNLRRYVVY